MRWSHNRPILKYELACSLLYRFPIVTYGFSNRVPSICGRVLVSRRRISSMDPPVRCHVGKGPCQRTATLPPTHRPPASAALAASAAALAASVASAAARSLASASARALASLASVSFLAKGADPGLSNGARGTQNMRSYDSASYLVYNEISSSCGGDPSYLSIGFLSDLQNT